MINSSEWAAAVDEKLQREKQSTPSGRPQTALPRRPPLLSRPNSIIPWRTEGNPFLFKGYIGPTATLKDIFHPAHHHNETINIYSHFIGCLFFVVAAVTFPSRGPSRMSKLDLFVMEMYCFGVCACFGLSTIHHACGHISKDLYNRSRQLDIVGISVLMGGAGPAMVYYGLYGHASLQNYYFILTALVWAAVVLVLATRTNSMSIPMRIRVLASLAVPGLAAVVHGIVLSTAAGSERALKLQWIFWTLGLNISGAVFYVSQFPECYFKGRFDVHGASHQIFHILILGASITFWWGLLDALGRIHGVVVV